ncbi:MAG: HTH domain-containing protein [Prevotellaceae bacterium]|jgi:ATP-dependent DNA helicase RecG|nr:HTH domain-containing protein [Prevotellaceae bacterium]
MIVHRDYSHHGESSIKIFNDRIEFFNPGRLPDSITEEDLRNGAYVSSCRNKLIAKVFKEITWIERYGTGIRRVTSLLERYGCPKPVFENFQHGFRVTAYPLQEVEKTVEKIKEGLGEKLGESQQRIMKIMRGNKFVTIPKLAGQLTISETAVQNNIAKLKAKGLFERVGPDKGGYWKINRQP